MKPNFDTRVKVFITVILVWSSNGHMLRGDEPYYEKRPLSDWLFAEPNVEQANAISHIGTNAIPTLLEILGATDRTSKRIARKLDNKSILIWVKSEDFREEDFQRYAVRAFQILGTNADTAIPRLRVLLNEQDTSLSAAQALAAIGPEGYMVLTNHAEGAMTGNLALALGENSNGDPTAIHILIVALKNNDPGVRANAADSLINKDPKQAIPALTEALDDNDPYVLSRVAGALGSYGARAEGACPKLVSVFSSTIANPKKDAETNLGLGILANLRKINSNYARKAEEIALAGGPLNITRTDYTKTRLDNGVVLIAGGYLDTWYAGRSQQCLSDAELLDPKTGKWTETGRMNLARYGHTAELQADGDVLIAGGYDKTGKIASSELYNPNSGTWIIVTNSHK
jgi:HEAT repeats/Galactose oxidase, central domain